MPPVQLLNSRGQSVLTLFVEGGDKGNLLGVGLKVNGAGDQDTSWLGVATHEEGGAYASGDGFVLVGGYDEVDDGTMHPILVDATGRLLTAVSSAGGTPTDAGNLDIDTGGASQQVFGANLSRRYLFIQNLDTSEDLWINFGASATIGNPSILIPALGSFVMEAGYVATSTVTAIAATTSHEFTAKEG